MRQGRRPLTIAMLMGAVLFVGIGFALTKNASDPIAIAVFTAHGLALLVVTLGACLGRGPRWVGFAVFGWGAMLCIFGPGSTAPVPTPLTTKAAEAIRDAVVRATPPTTTVSNQRFTYSLTMTQFGSTAVLPPSQSIPIMQVVQTLFALLFALLGAFLAPWLVPKRNPEPTSRGPEDRSETTADS